jgi:hypothetical protein
MMQVTLPVLVVTVMQCVLRKRISIRKPMDIVSI